MGRILISFKTKLITEAFYQFFVEKLKPNWEIDIKPKAGKNYEIIIFDKNSLKELPQEAYPESKKLLLDDGASESEIIFLFLYYKLSGIISCETTPENFLKALEVVSRGEIWLSRGLVKKLCEDYETFSAKDLPSLTPKEKEIGLLINKGLSNKEIANHLSISIHTVKSCINRIFKKTGVKRRGQLIKLFMNSSQIVNNVPEIKKGIKKVVKLKPKKENNTS